MKLILKNYFIGFLIFLIPILSYFNIKNINQLALYDIKLIFISIIFLIILLLFMALIIDFILYYYFNKNYQFTFPIFSLGFYLSFFFEPLSSLNQSEYFNYFILITMFIIVLSFFYFTLISNKFLRLFRYFCFIYSIYFIIFFLINIYFYFTQQNIFKININNSNFNYDISYSVVNTNKNNIYYIILDNMMSLDLAHSYNFIDKKSVLKELEDNQIFYIDNSHSNYSQSIYSLASIFNLNFLEYKNNNFNKSFPNMMYQSEYSIPLTHLINKLGYNFIWVDNSIFDGGCLNIKNQPWKCLNSSSYRNVIRLQQTLFINTPMKAILGKFLPEQKLLYDNSIDNNQRALKNFTKYLLSIKKKENSNFIFIKQGSPHFPYRTNNLCEKKIFSGDKTNILGYQNSYLCVLSEIKEFVKFLKEFDPNSILVIQGDHSITFEEKSKITSENIYANNTSIFNAIVAPKDCFNKFEMPRSSINMIRFVINCNFNLNLNYTENIFYYKKNEKLISQNF